MLFSASMHRLLSPGTSEKMVDWAKEMLISFIESLGQLYGKREIMNKIHQLTHRRVKGVWTPGQHW